MRAELEERVGAANQGITDPVARLAGGMRVAVQFGLAERARATVMLRGMEAATAIDHELNRGIRADIDALVAAGLARGEAQRSGVRYWLGLCQIAMLNAIERQHPRPDAADRLREMLVLGLTGLGVGDAAARAAAQAAADQLLAGD